MVDELKKVDEVEEVVEVEEEVDSPVDYSAELLELKEGLEVVKNLVSGYGGSLDSLKVEISRLKSAIPSEEVVEDVELTLDDLFI